METGKEPYRVVAEGGSGEIVEKKSRFIATIQPVETEEEALAFIEAMKKKYWDARHNCSAFIIGKRGELQRCSDDGEPGGTAGRPMLEVLQKQELCNVAVVVTRYFGGVLLGTGGLVRAYTKAVQEGLAASRICTMMPVALVEVHTDYNAIGKVKYILAQAEVPIRSEEYTTEVALTYAVPLEQQERIEKELTEATGGKAKIEEKEQKFMAV